MLTEFATLQFNHEELLEMHQALLQRAMIEDELRRERGLEKIERHALLEKIEGLIGLAEERLADIDHQAEDDMWEFSWYAFTDEWAWHRAAQDIDRESVELPNKPSETERKKMVESRYREKFDAYVSEVDMRDTLKEKLPAAKQNRKPSA